MCIALRRDVFPLTPRSTPSKARQAANRPTKARRPSPTRFSAPSASQGPAKGQPQQPTSTLPATTARRLCEHLALGAFALAYTQKLVADPRSLPGSPTFAVTAHFHAGTTRLAWISYYGTDPGFGRMPCTACDDFELGCLGGADLEATNPTTGWEAENVAIVRALLGGGDL